VMHQDHHHDDVWPRASPLEQRSQFRSLGNRRRVANPTLPTRFKETPLHVNQAS